MAHKARRRPSWKKPRSKHFTRYERSEWRDLMDSLAKKLAEEIDKEILAELLLSTEYGA